MSLSLVATPIGNLGDITARAMTTLREAEIIIGEERRELTTLLKRLGIEPRELELLNEHTDDSEVARLANLCTTKKVALISDCGTPGFCDPGPRLIAQLRARAVPVTAVPGASSLMTILSLSSVRLNDFVFRGFLPAETEQRMAAIASLAKESRAIVLLDTPYRLGRVLEDLARAMPQRRALLALDLTLPNERLLENSLAQLSQTVSLPNADSEKSSETSKPGKNKAEWILLIYAGT